MKFRDPTFRHAFLLLLAAGGASSCTAGAPGGGSPLAAAAPGPGVLVDGLVLGQGYDAITGKPREVCADPGPVDTQSGQELGTTAEARVTVVDDAASLATYLDLAAWTPLPGSAALSPRLALVGAVPFNDYARHVLVQLRIGNQLHIATSMVLKSWAKALYLSDAHAFRDRCGTEVVSGYRTGAEYQGVVELATRTPTQIADGRELVDRLIVGWQQPAGITALLDTTKSLLATKLYSCGFGLGAPYLSGCSNDAPLDSLETTLTGWDAIAKQLASPEVLEVSFWSYDGLVGAGATPTAFLPLFQAEARLVDLGTSYAAAAKREGTVAMLRAMPGGFAPFNLQDPAFAEIDVVPADLATRASRCRANPWATCPAGSSSLLQLTLPAGIAVSPEELCAEERHMLLDQGVITGDDYKAYRAIGEAPTYVQPGVRSSGIEGWYPCRLAAPVF